MKQFEVTYEGEIAAPPEAVWDGFTRRADGWLWPIEYEPRVGGAEHGLSAEGGIVTAWEPAKRFATRAERDDGWWNTLEYRLEPTKAGTYVRYTHRSVVTDDTTYDVEVDACKAHTALYCHSLGEYVCHFGGRRATYVDLDAHEPRAGDFDRVAVALGAHAVGDPVHVAPAATRGVVDYRDERFLGIRTDDALLRVYGRDAWGWPVGIGLHLFDPAADGPAAEAAWRVWLDDVLTTERSAA